ncbi:hypothetical protein [Hyphobacterium sp.]|uniref:hypothetical protein n=1 Tax=Hyphobacterium sp. TaxID=2004662 RepID=UPI003B530027
MKNDHLKPRDPKKTVSIEVRVSEEDKQAFWDACRAADQPASAVLRRLMGIFVAIRNLRQKMFSMINRFFRRLLSSALAASAMAASLAVSLIIAPLAAADVRLTYQVIVDDGIGQIVSQGQTVIDENDDDPSVIADGLGEGVRYAFTAQACDAADNVSCAEGTTMVVLSLWESHEGQDVIATDQGIALSLNEETRFETVLSDGRILSVLFLPQS